MPPEPSEKLAHIFIAFARVGIMGFGGPAAQIALAHRTFVEQRRWVTPERFTRALAVYQALPGPEALEMCCWLGAVRAGRAGAIAAGLGFALPGTLLVLIAALLYVQLVGATGGVAPGLRAAMIAGLALAQGVVVVLMLKAGLDLAARCLGTPASLKVWKKPSESTPCRYRPELLWGLLIISACAWCALQMSGDSKAPALSAGVVPAGLSRVALTSELDALLTGLKAGSLSFGGAYTAVPILQHSTREDVSPGAFLDGLAIVICLPAPLVALAAFVGTLAGGPLVGLVMFAGIIAPAMAITLFGHGALERLVNWRAAHAVLDALAAIAIGLVIGTAIVMGRTLFFSQSDSGGAATAQGLGPDVGTAVQVAGVLAFLVLVLMMCFTTPSWRRRWGGYVPAALVLGAVAIGAALSVLGVV